MGPERVVVRSEGRTTNPRSVLAVFWDYHVDPCRDHPGFGKVTELRLETFTKTPQPSSAATEDNICVKTPPQVLIAIGYGVAYHLMDTIPFQSVQVWFEKQLWACKPFTGNSDIVAVRIDRVVLFTLVACLGLSLLRLKIGSNIGEFLLDITNDVLLSGSSEVVTPLIEAPLKISGDVTAS